MGDVKREAGVYKFQNGMAWLDSSLTASWDATIPGNGLTLTQNGGQVQVRATNVKLSAPAFMFFSPKANQSGGLTFDFSPVGYSINIDKTKNDAVLHIDIPGSTCKLEKVTPNGSELIFEGEMSISTPALDVAGIKMEKLGMGFSNGQYAVSGIKAGGAVSMNKLVGMEVAEVEANIDTFAPYDTYGFKLSLDVEVFSTEAELELKRINSGALIPNNLTFEIGGEPGIPIVPPAIVARLKSGGGGFYNLADTVNGAYEGLPPIQLMVTAGGEVLEVLEGKAVAKIGAGSLDLSLEDAKIVELPFVEKLRYYMLLSTEKRTYNSVQYTGGGLKSGWEIGLGIPLDDPIIKAGAAFGWDMYAGRNHNAYNNLYLAIGADGKLYGLVQTPESWPVIGGIKLASADFAFTLGGETAFHSDSETSLSRDIGNAVENISAYGSVCHEASFGISDDMRVSYRVYYIFKNGVGFDAEFGSLAPFDPRTTAAVYNDAGEITGLAFTDEPLVAAAESGEKAQSDGAVGARAVKGTIPGVTLQQTDLDGKLYTMQVTSSAPSGGRGLMLQIVPHDGVVDSGFLNNLDISSGGNALDIYPVKANPANSDGELDEVFVYNAGNHRDIDAAADACGENAIPSDGNAIVSGGNSLPGVPQERDSLTVMLDWTGGFSWNDVRIAGSEAFDVACVQAKPFIKLKSVAASSASLNYEVEDPDNSKEYALRLYLGKKTGGTDYLLSQTGISNSDVNGSVALTLNGQAAPTGEYYVTAALLEKKVVNGKDVWISCGLKSTADKVDYTNNDAPGAATNVTLTAIGGEMLRAQWDQVDCDGYYISVYQKDGSNWVDTGAGYKVEGKDNTALDMALTVGGKASEQTSLNAAPLQAVKNYRVGVTAFNYTNANDDADPIRGAETLSDDDGTLLPAANYPTLTYAPAPINQNGMKVLSVKSAAPTDLTVSATRNAAITVKRMDTNALLVDGTTGPHTLTLPTDFQGTLMLEVTAAATEGGLTDRTVDYISLRLDDVPPAVVIDQGVFLADQKTGAFTVSGYTEAFATLTMTPLANQHEAGVTPGAATTVTADAAGRFTFSGTLNDTDGTVGAKRTDVAFIDVRAADAAGNNTKGNAYVVRNTQTPSSGGDSGGYSGSGGESIATPVFTNPIVSTTVPVISGKSATLTVTANDATSYQWQVDRGDGQGWVSIPGATEANYTTERITAKNVGYKYRCIASNKGGGWPSPVFSLTLLNGVADVPVTGDSDRTLWVLLPLGLGTMVALKKKRRRI